MRNFTKQFAAAVIGICFALMLVPTIPGAAQEKADDRQSENPVKDRTLVNASLIFRNFRKGWEFQVSGFNLFDADHRDPDSTGGLYDDMPGQGTSFTGKVSYSF